MASLAAHPIRTLYDRGIPVTVSSDDPLPFFTTIEREYRLVGGAVWVQSGGTQRMTLGALEASFLEPGERAALQELVLEGYDDSHHPATGTA